MKIKTYKAMQEMPEWLIKHLDNTTDCHWQDDLLECNNWLTQKYISRQQYKLYLSLTNQTATEWNNKINKNYIKAYKAAYCSKFAL